MIKYPDYFKEWRDPKTGEWKKDTPEEVRERAREFSEWAMSAHARLKKKGIEV